MAEAGRASDVSDQRDGLSLSHPGSHLDVPGRGHHPAPGGGDLL